MTYQRAFDSFGELLLGVNVVTSRVSRLSDYVHENSNHPYSHDHEKARQAADERRLQIWFSAKPSYVTHEKTDHSVSEDQEIADGIFRDWIRVTKTFDHTWDRGKDKDTAADAF